MKSLFNKIDNQEIISRIEKLTPSSQSKWGKMNVSQMLAHCQEPLFIAFGERKLKRGLVALLFGKMVKNQLIKDEKPFKHNLPTDKTFVVTEQKEFNKEKTTLMNLIKRFEITGAAGISQDPHPFFGTMSAQEWDTIQWKHLDHHLNQFGV